MYKCTNYFTRNTAFSVAISDRHSLKRFCNPIYDFSWLNSRWPVYLHESCKSATTPHLVSFYWFSNQRQVQCSSDISELRIRVLYARILRIRVCLYAYTRMAIRVYAYVNTRVYVPLLCIPISFFIWSIVGQTKDIGEWKGFKAKFAYC